MKNFLPRYFSRIPYCKYLKGYCKFVILMLLGSFTFLSSFSYAQNVSHQIVSVGTENIILVSDAKIYTAKTTDNGLSVVITTAKNKKSKEKIAVKKVLKPAIKEIIVEKPQPKIANKVRDYTHFYKEQNSGSAKYFSQNRPNQILVNLNDFHFIISKNFELQSQFKPIVSFVFYRTILSEKNGIVSPFPVRGPPFFMS